MDHPEISVLVLRTVSTWSLIDQSFAMLAAKCLTADFRIVTAILGKLRSTEAARAVVTAIVSDQLKGSADLELFEAISTILRQERQLRNKYAHWLWGTSPDVPTKIVLADPMVALRYMDEAHERVAVLEAAESAGEEAIVDPMPAFSKEGLFVLSKNGARIGLRNAIQCHKWLSHFYSVRFFANLDPQKSEQLRNQLRSEARVRNELSRVTKQGSP